MLALLAAGATRLALRRAGLVVRSDDDSDPAPTTRPTPSIAPPRPVLHGLPEASSGSPPFESAYNICRGADGEVETLGAGSFGAAVLVRDVRTGALAACKEIPKRSLRGPRDVADVRREIFALRRLRGHPGIVTLLAPFECKTHVRVVTEFLDGGELFDAIVDAGCFSELDAARCFHQIVDALAFCHDAGIAHRDVKPENLMIKNPTEAEKRAFRERSSEESESESSPPLRVVAIDFGLCVEKTESDGPCEEVAGTPYYVAPEVLERNYDPFKADVWSAGVVLYVLLTGYPPFASASDAETMALIKSRPAPDFSDVPSAEAAGVLAAAFRREEDRPSAREMLAMPWVGAGAYTPPATREADHERRAATRAAAARARAGAGEGSRGGRRRFPAREDAHVDAAAGCGGGFGGALGGSRALRRASAVGGARAPPRVPGRGAVQEDGDARDGEGDEARGHQGAGEDVPRAGQGRLRHAHRGRASRGRRGGGAERGGGGGGGGRGRRPRARLLLGRLGGRWGKISFARGARGGALRLRRRRRRRRVGLRRVHRLDDVRGAGGSRAEPARAFDHFDEDNSGFITIEEARRVLDEFGSKVSAQLGGGEGVSEGGGRGRGREDRLGGVREGHDQD